MITLGRLQCDQLATSEANVMTLRGAHCIGRIQQFAQSSVSWVLLASIDDNAFSCHHANDATPPSPKHA